MPPLEETEDRVTYRAHASEVRNSSPPVRRVVEARALHSTCSANLCFLARHNAAFQKAPSSHTNPKLSTEITPLHAATIVGRSFKMRTHHLVAGIALCRCCQFHLFTKPISKRSTFRNGRPSWMPCARGGVHQVHPSFHDSNQWFTWQPVKQRNVSPSTTIIIIMLPPRSPEIPRCSHAAPALPAASPWQRSGTTSPTPFARACKPRNSTVACRVCRC